MPENKTPQWDLVALMAIFCLTVIAIIWILFG